MVSCDAREYCQGVPPQSGMTEAAMRGATGIDRYPHARASRTGLLRRFRNHPPDTVLGSRRARKLLRVAERYKVRGELLVTNGYEVADPRQRILVRARMGRKG